MTKSIQVKRIDGQVINITPPKKRKKWTRDDYILVSMASLGLVFLALFAYAPMFGLVLAFKEDGHYISIVHTLLYAPWAGFDQFEAFFTDPEFGNIMLNTLGLNILQLLINFPAPIIFAVLMSELISDRFKKFVQTVTFFPHFLSWVIFGGIFLSLLDYDSGILNAIIKACGGNPVDILGGEQYFWGLIIITSILKGLGWGSVIYVAAISGIPNELYEAAKIDGANRWHKIRYITVPTIAPTITLFLILSISGLLNNGIDHLWVFQNASNITRSEVLDTYIYKFGIPQFQYGYATAIGMLKSIVSLILLVSGNAICKKISGKGIY